MTYRTNALRLGGLRMIARIRRDARQRFGFDKTVYVDQRVAEYERYWREAARILGATFDPLTESIWEIRRDGQRTRIKGHVVAADDPVTLQIAGDKSLCHRIARRAGVRVPECLEFELQSLRRARDRVAADPGPWVVKPANGSSSALGITTGIDEAAQLERAAVLASLFSRRLLLERHVPGESCRLLYLDGGFISAVRRRGLRVVGDGAATVRELMIRAGWSTLINDRLCTLHLNAQRLAYTSVPASGAAVVVHGAPIVATRQQEIRTVYDEPITDLVNDQLIDGMRRVVRSVGSRFAGVDVITTDPSLPLEQTGGAFIEINTTPGIHHHYQAAADHEHHPVAVAVLESLLGLHGEAVAAD